LCEHVSYIGWGVQRQPGGTDGLPKLHSTMHVMSLFAVQGLRQSCAADNE